MNTQMSSFSKAADNARKAEEYQPKTKMPKGTHNQGDWYYDQQNSYNSEHWQDSYRPDDSRM